MQWRLDISKTFVKVLLFTCISHAFALDESRLWLASSKKNLWSDLVRAAQAAESLDRCEKVMEGTLDREQSKPDYPIYRILCKQPDGRNYNEMVDGVTFITLTTPPPRTELTEEEKEAARQHQLVLQTNAWQRCHAEIQERTKLMLERVLLVNEQPEHTLSDSGELQFVVPFDAKSISGVSLRYVSTCSVPLEGPVSTVLIKRREIPATTSD
jgi:hypothetical protein